MEPKTTQPTQHSSDEGFYGESDKDSDDALSPRGVKNQLPEQYNYIPPPLPLIPKSLAQYEPPKIAFNFPFLVMRRLHGVDVQYLTGPEMEGYQGLQPPEGSLRNFFERNARRIVYSRCPGDENTYENNVCDLRKLINQTSAATPVANSQGPDPYYRPSSPTDRTLQFESRFECGNLNYAMKINDNEYCLSLQNDTNSKGNTQWFYFRVENTSVNFPVTFNILNFCKNDSLFNHGMKVLVFSERDNQESNRGWFRDGDNIRYYSNGIWKNGTNKTYYTLTFRYTFKHADDTVYFAYGYPYTYTELMEDLAEIEGDQFKSSISTRRLLCSTIAGNRWDVLTITSQGSFDEVRRRKGWVITGRVHPGETVGSWMMKGVLDFLTANNQEAKILRDNFVFKVIPMLNPDGVIAGNYRTGLVGADLNRRWKTPSKMLHPVIYHAKNMIRDFSKERSVEMICDLHGHSKRKNVFMYGWDVQTQPELTRAIPYILSKVSPFFCYDYCRFKVQKSKDSTLRVSLFKEMRIPCVYTMESTFCGANFGQYLNMHMTLEDFKSMGRDLLRALLIKWDLQPKAEDPSPTPSDIPQVNFSGQDIMKELVSSEQLLTDPQDAGSSGSDSDPSEDNMDADELEKYVPTKNKKEKAKTPRKTTRRSSKRINSASSSKSRITKGGPQRCSKCNEIWTRGHKCPEAEPPPPIPKPPAPRNNVQSRYAITKSVGLNTYYNSAGKKVHDQATQTHNSVFRNSTNEESKTPEKPRGLLPSFKTPTKK